MLKKEKWHNIVVNFGFSNDEYKIVRPSILQSNYNSIKSLGLVGAIYLLVFSILYFFIKNNSSYLVFIGASLLCFLSWILSITVAKKNLEFLRFCIYILVVAFMGAGIAIGIFYEPSYPCIGFICYMLILPMIFVERPYKMAISMLVMMVTYSSFAFFNKDTSIFLTDFINIFFFGSIAVIVNTFLGRVKVENILNELKINEIAHRDELTTLHNRNCFEERIGSYSKQITSSLACLYFDVNGLHDVNNSCGHEIGDKMLKEIADIIINEVGLDNSYRTGGDEYVVFILDKDLSDVEKIKDTIASKISNAGYSISIGLNFSEKENLDMHSLISLAEKLMYQEKERYYISIGDTSNRCYLREHK